MATDADSSIQNPEAEVSSRRRGIGLCLSGGGFRATLFHAGVIQRLFELGVAGRPEFETVASVSGGSITAAQWAVAEAGLLRPGTNGTGPRNDGERNGGIASAGGNGWRPRNDGGGIDFVRDVVRPLLALTRRDIRTGAMAQKYLLPWNWFRGAFVVNNMVDKFEGAFGKGTLDLLPER